MKEINTAIVKDNGRSVKCIATINGIEVSECQINMDRFNGNIKWIISSWFTKKGFKNQGIGRYTMGQLLHYCIAIYGYPTEVEYVWNGANEYVLDWMTKHFNAICTCPIAVQKTQSDDDWSSHVYKLNVNSVLEYFSY